MQKIIRGKKYNTDTAKEVCCYSNNLPFGDFDSGARNPVCKTYRRVFLTRQRRSKK